MKRQGEKSFWPRLDPIEAYTKSIETRQPVENVLVTLHAAVTALPDFIYVFDLDGRFAYTNPALSSLLQRTPEDMVGLNFHDLGYPYELACTLQAQIQEVIDTRDVVRAETLFEAASGPGYYEYIFAPIFNADREVTAVAGTTRDITERRRAEDALRQSQKELRAERQKLHNLFEQAPAFIAILAGSEFVFDFANEDYYRLIGRRDILGKTLLEVLPEVADQGYIDILRQVFSTGQSFVGHGMQVRLADGGGGTVNRYVDFIYQAMRDPSGVIDSILVHGIDVTDRVQAQQEVERLNIELEERVKERTLQYQAINQEMEGFTYSVSHDLRAPLRAIVSSSSILLRDFEGQLDAQAAQELRRQAAAANRLAVLIDELLKLSRLTRQEMRRQTVDLSALAKEVSSELSVHNLDNGCQFLIADGIMATADPATLRLLLTNLLGNACKFSPSGGTVEIGQSLLNGEVAFWVRDQGVGFDMQYVAKIFLPFERLVLDDQYPGSGIGLANVKRIVERHGGRIWAESVPGDGATFFFTLPA